MNNIIKYIRTNFRYWILAVCALLFMQPYFIWNTAWGTISHFVFLLILLKSYKADNMMGGQILLSFLYLYMAIMGNYTIIGAITTIAFIPLFFVNSDELEKTFNCFIRIYAVLIAISAVVFVLVFYLNIDLPHHSIVALNQLKDVEYDSFFLMVNSKIQGFYNMRFMGLFDEPGVVGTISSVLLISEHFNLKKWYNIIILITGFLSFSFFFYVVIWAYILLFAPVKTKIYSFVIVILSLSIPAVMDNEFLNMFIIDRIFNADNISDLFSRSRDSFEIWYSNFRFSSDYFFGLGGQAHLKYDLSGASYKHIIVDYGLIYFVLYILGFYLIARHKILESKDLILYMTLFLSVLYQRPFIGMFSYLFLLYIPIIIMSTKNSFKI